MSRCLTSGMRKSPFLVYLEQILHTYLFQHCAATDMQNGDFAKRGILMKMLITLELHGIFGSKFCIFVHFNIANTLNFKTVTRLRRASVRMVVVRCS